MGQPTREYRVWFTNVTGCAVGISDISWSVTVAAKSEATALASALDRARLLNQASGLPPHGLRVSEEELRRLACVLPEKPPLRGSGIRQSEAE